MSFWCLHSLPKKGSWQIVMSNLFVRFLEEMSAWKNHFDFVWPLHSVKSTVKISSIFVAFLEKMNFKRPNDSMSGCIRYGYVVEIKHVNFCFCAWLHEQGRRRSAKQQKPNVPLHRAHFGEIFPEEAFAFLCPLRWPIKFRYCEKTIKLVTSKQSMRFLQFFVTFSDYPNFLLQFLLWKEENDSIIFS